MPDTSPPPIEIETGPAPNASLIWLHGLGADGHDFVPIADELALPMAVRFVFPHAPLRPVTLNGGYVMRAWYDILGLSAEAPEDVEGIMASGEALAALIEREHQRGIAHSRILLAGFSQGGSVALHTALRYPQRLGGVLALSTWLPLPHAAAGAASPASRGLPVFMAHGDDDTVVAPALSDRSAALLRTLSLQLDVHRYLMGHAVIPSEIADIQIWLTRVLG
jgi:phospholipase/carboxylesterase